MSDTFGPQLDALAASLRDAGLAASVDDVRDILWLAEVRGPAAGPAASVSGPITADTDRRRAEVEASGIDARATGTPATPTRDEPTLYASAQHGRIEAGMLHVPGVTVSPAPADLRRALQPLARYVASTTRWQVDDEATATYKADTGAWRLCLQPLRERWFDLNVIVEASPSMRLWRTEVDSFVRVLKGQGGFRSLRRFVLAGPGPALLHTADGSPGVPLAALQPAGRQALTLLVSDTGSVLWRSGAAQRFLFSAGALMPLSVMQLLPARAWRHTALGEPEMAARTTHPGSPNAQLLRVGDDDEIDADDGLDADRCLIPLLSFDPPSIRRWALAMAGRVNASMPCAAVTRNPAPPSESSLNQTASEAVAAFRRKVSQAAYDLAVFLTVPDPLTLPVMRLVQRTMLPDTGTAELSECLLGGLLVPTSADAVGGAVYRFRDGVRDELIRALRYSEETLVTQQLARVGRTLEQAHVAGAGSEFSAYFPQPGGGARLSEWALPFATVSRRILQALQPPEPDPLHEAGSPSANAEVNAGPVAATPSPQAGPRPSAYLSAVHAETEQLQPWINAFRCEGLQVMTMTALLAANDDLSGRVRFGLGQASCALVAISHAWHTSKWCQQEARLLSERARNDPSFHIITLRLDDAAMPFDFQSGLTLDLRGGTRPDLTTIHALVDGLRGASLKASDEGRRKVLWVDDVPNNNVRERKIMESMGLEFTLARSTREALGLFETLQFAAIISDMGRVEGPREGYVLLEAIRALDPDIPFFIYAGSKAVQHRREAVQNGAQGSTNEPNELIAWVDRAVTKSVLASPAERNLQPALEPWFADKEPQIVTIGSLIAEFRTGLDAITRRAVAENLLLAQLIADKSDADDSSINGWFEQHSDALKDTGWIVQNQSIMNQQFAATEGNVRKAIVPMLYTMLGPMLADSSLLLPLLDGLGQRRTQPQGLQVFHRFSNQRTGARFQVAFIEADADGNPDVRLFGIGIKTEHAIPAVLFFKTTDERARIQQATGHLTIDRSGLESTRDAIAHKVASRIPAMVRNLEL